MHRTAHLPSAHSAYMYRTAHLPSAHSAVGSRVRGWRLRSLHLLGLKPSVRGFQSDGSQAFALSALSASRCLANPNPNPTPNPNPNPNLTLSITDSRCRANLYPSQDARVRCRACCRAQRANPTPNLTIPLPLTLTLTLSSMLILIHCRTYVPAAGPTVFWRVQCASFCSSQPLLAASPS
jgi:hypothetical protein